MFLVHSHHRSVHSFCMEPKSEASAEDRTLPQKVFHEANVRRMIRFVV